MPGNRASRTAPSHGSDSGFTLAFANETNGPATAKATGNVALYAKVMTLVINSDLWTGLDDAQRAIITTASDATRAWAIANQKKDAAAAVNSAPAADRGPRRRRLRRRLPRRRGPGLRALEADPLTKRAIAAIKSPGAGTSVAGVEGVRPGHRCHDAGARRR